MGQTLAEKLTGKLVAASDWQASPFAESVRQDGITLMPDIEVTDQLDKRVETIKINLSHPSSLIKYLKSELLHLAVLPDFLALKDSILSQAATKPIQFQAKAQHSFQLDAADAREFPVLAGRRR
jgi:hypothetical protein